MESDAKQIPIENIYYLLCYAWNKLDEGDLVDVSASQCSTVLNLLANVLSKGIGRLIKRGIDRGYVNTVKETRTLRGKIDFGRSTKRCLLKHSRAVCTFDEFKVNVLHNQILKSTIRLLLGISGIDDAVVKELHHIYRHLPEVQTIRITPSVFRKVQLHRNNSFYEFLLRICELIMVNLLPSEEAGANKFRDFTRDENQMAGLFESFVRNFYRLEQNHFNVSRDIIPWKEVTADERALGLLPKMETDITLRSPERMVVIDTKFYREALTSRFDRKKLVSSNIYQIHAYLDNIEHSEDVLVEGMLLYPVVKHQLDEHYTLHGHPLHVATVNLNQDWHNIRRDLLSLVGILH